MSKKKASPVETANQPATECMADPVENYAHRVLSVTPHEDTPPGMQIVAMQVDNIKRISCVRVRPNGQVITVSGANESGKSSLLDAIEMAIGGTRTIPSKPIKDGQRTGSIRINFGDFEVLRTFTKVENGKTPFLTKLQIFGRNNTRYDKPQELLDGFMGAISFDPLAFIRMDSKKQLETLRGIVKFDIDLDQLEAERAEAYDLRRDAGREVEALRARLAAMPAPPEGLPETAISVDELILKVEQANKNNTERSALFSQRQLLINEAAACGDRSRRAAARADELRQQAVDMDKVAATEDAAHDAKQEEAAKIFLPQQIDMADISLEISAANVTNGAIQRRDAYRSVQKQLEESQKKWKDLDATVLSKHAERDNAIAGAKMPIDGLSIGEGEVIYNGIPFDQASNAVQIKTSVAIAISSNPTMRVLRIKDGSLLDDNNMRIISEMAQHHGYQIWIEVVNANGKASVVMEEGEASGEDVETPYRESDKMAKRE